MNAAGLALVPEGRAILGRMSIHENLVLAGEKRQPRAAQPRSDEELVDRADLAPQLVRPVREEQRVADNAPLQLEDQRPAAVRLFPQGPQRPEHLLGADRPGPGVLAVQREAHADHDIVVHAGGEAPHAGTLRATSGIGYARRGGSDRHPLVLGSPRCP